MNATLAFKSFEADKLMPAAKDSGFLSFMINFGFYGTIVGQGCCVCGCLIACCMVVVGGAGALANIQSKFRGGNDDQFGRF